MYIVHMKKCTYIGKKANLWTVDKDQTHPQKAACCNTKTQV